MAAQRVAHCCSCCLSCQIPVAPTVTTRPAAADSTLVTTAFRLQRLKLQWRRRRSADLALSLLRTFLQRLPTAVAYPCAFSQSVFTPGLSSSHQISHFWSSLGHHGHCCVFGVVFGLFGTQRVSRLPFSALPSLVAECLTCSRSGGRTATAACHVLSSRDAHRSPAASSAAATTLAASQMHLLSLRNTVDRN